MKPVMTFAPKEAAELRARLDAIADKGWLTAEQFAAALDGTLAGFELAAALLANAEVYGEVPQ
jgi:hypothetical protein